MMTDLKQMIYESLEYINLYYYENDKYILSLKKNLELLSKEIVDFFELKDFGDKVDIKIYNNIDDFRKLCADLHYGTVDKVPLWACGFCNNIDGVPTICVLSLEEYRKTKGHETGTLDDIKYLIMHEFVHACHCKIGEIKYKWLSEGLATTISHQYDYHEYHLDATLDEMIHGAHNYANYYTMFSYVYNTYGKEYIFSLIKNFELLEKDTPRLYNETCEYVHNIDYKKL